jgi:hypothetical protein
VQEWQERGYILGGRSREAVEYVVRFGVGVALDGEVGE